MTHPALRIAALLVLVILIASCQQHSDAPSEGSSPDQQVLRVYRAPSDQADEIGYSLKLLLSGREQDPNVGSAMAFPNGQIAVRAPASMHSNIESLIEQHIESKSETGRQVRIRQWLIEGTTADRTVVPDSLSFLEQELRDTAQAIGDMEFKRLETIEHVTTGQGNSRLSGKLLDTSMQSEISGDIVLLQLQVRTAATGSMSTNVRIESGQNLVFAQVEKDGSGDSPSGKIIVFAIQATIL